MKLKLCLMISLFASGRVLAINYILSDPATWRWEISADGGMTWGSTLVTVPQSTPSVLVRGVAEFPPAPFGYFGYTSFDVFSRGTATVGAGDTIESIARGRFADLNRLRSYRLGDYLKIDSNSDAQLPGQGSDWASCSQSPPSIIGAPIPSYDNPAVPLWFTLNLDGTVGDRFIASVGPRLPGFNLDRYMSSYRYQFAHQADVYFHLLIESPVTLRVVPTPAGMTCLGIALAALRRRR